MLQSFAQMKPDLVYSKLTRLLISGNLVLLQRNTNIFYYFTGGAVNTLPRWDQCLYIKKPTNIYQHSF